MPESIRFNKYIPPERKTEDVKKSLETYKNTILNLLAEKNELMLSEIRYNLGIEGGRQPQEKQDMYDSIKMLLEEKLIRISGLETVEDSSLETFTEYTKDTYFTITPEGKNWLTKNKKLWKNTK